MSLGIHLVKAKLKSDSHFRAARVSILAFLPVLAIGLLFLSNPYAWEFIAVDYAMLPLFVGVFVFIFIVYLLVEITRRASRAQWIERLPWFSLVVAGALSTLFFVGQWATPFVMEIPNWCRVSQTIRGETSKDRRFIMALHGRGNEKSHEWERGFVKFFNAEERKSLDLRLRPIKFGWWDGYNHVFVSGSPEELKQHIQHLNYADDELITMSREIWAILIMASEGNQLSSEKHVVEPIWATPNHESHHRFGCLIWLTCFLLAFVAIGQLTLTRQRLENAT